MLAEKSALSHEAPCLKEIELKWNEIQVPSTCAAEVLEGLKSKVNTSNTRIKVDIFYIVMKARSLQAMEKQAL